MADRSMSQVGVQQLVPLLMVRSMEASLRFYVDGLGFRMTNQWTPEGRIRWCWLEHGTAALMLQELGPTDKRRHELDEMAAGVGFYFVCRDALAFYHIVKERGIAVKQPFVGNRMWVTSLLDPDDYRLHFESPTDSPEETVYTG
jgi:lactoylglutathione lyase